VPFPTPLEACGSLAFAGRPSARVPRRPMREPAPVLQHGGPIRASGPASPRAPEFCAAAAPCRSGLQLILHLIGCARSLRCTKILLHHDMRLRYTRAAANRRGSSRGWPANVPVWLTPGRLSPTSQGLERPAHQRSPFPHPPPAPCVVNRFRTPNLVFHHTYGKPDFRISEFCSSFPVL
jgi:hypothetical protein